MAAADILVIHLLLATGVRVHVCVRMHTHPYTNTYTHIHTYICAYRQILSVVLFGMRQSPNSSQRATSPGTVTCVLQQSISHTIDMILGN